MNACSECVENKKKREIKYKKRERNATIYGFQHTQRKLIITGKRFQRMEKKTINSQDRIIKIPGHYILTENITSDDFGIIIESSNVFIDFSDHAISSKKCCIYAIKNISNIYFKNVILSSDELCVFFPENRDITIDNIVITSGGSGIVFQNCSNITIKNVLANSLLTGFAFIGNIDKSDKGVKIQNTRSKTPDIGYKFLDISNISLVGCDGSIFLNGCTNLTMM